MFTIYDYQHSKSLLWHNPTIDYLTKDNRRYDDIIESELTVKLVTNRRNPKKLFSKPIKQIIEQAKEL